MTDKVKNQEQRQADQAPELHNDEQDDHLSQAQEVAEDAQHPDPHSPLDSIKVGGGIDGTDSQDLIDRMRDMEQSGRIDMGAYRGEPNLDDNEDKYGPESKVDPDLPADGSGQTSQGSRI